jgi:hypothetical protein
VYYLSNNCPCVSETITPCTSTRSERTACREDSKTWDCSPSSSKRLRTKGGRELQTARDERNGVTDLLCRLPSDVQDEAIPLVLGGGDVMVAAETGSGKTGAFGLPAVQLAHEIARRRSSGRARPASSSSASSAPSYTLSREDRSPFVAVDPSGFVCQSRDDRKWGGVRGSVGEQNRPNRGSRFD